MTQQRNLLWRVNMNEFVQGSLFARDFLTESVAQFSDWRDFDDVALDACERALRGIFERFPTDRTPNESQTEDDLIWPVLGALGWTASLRQQNLSARGRDDVPDSLLFADDTTKDRANRCRQEWQRYEYGLAVVESKRWQRPLDRRSERRGEETAPSTQMLRYLRRVDDLTNGALRWGVLTNGVKWRLYYAGARSVSEQFFEIDLAAALGLPGHNDGLLALSEAERRHGLKLFALFFGRTAFLPDPASADPRSLHQRALEEGRFYEERVAADLSELVFKQVFPKLARAIAEAAPDAPLAEVRDAALILLYRLLFIMGSRNSVSIKLSSFGYCPNLRFFPQQKQWLTVQNRTVPSFVQRPDKITDFCMAESMAINARARGRAASITLATATAFSK